MRGMPAILVLQRSCGFSLEGGARLGQSHFRLVCLKKKFECWSERVRLGQKKNGAAKITCLAAENATLGAEAGRLKLFVDTLGQKKRKTLMLNQDVHDLVADFKKFQADDKTLKKRDMELGGEACAVPVYGNGISLCSQNAIHSGCSPLLIVVRAACRGNCK